MSDFANCSAAYGLLDAAIGLTTWTWLSAIILVGAELNSETGCQAAGESVRLGGLTSGPSI
jgi:membrane protein